MRRDLIPCSFRIFSVFLLSWPLRIYAECRTAMLNYQVTKLFGTCYLSPSSVNYTGPLTRTSTMETVELEAALGREQYFVVPSYSEAMLMPHATVVNSGLSSVIYLAGLLVPLGRRFFDCQGSPSSVNYTGPLTRTSTMETVELEAALGREQYFVVPSYSEAMLMPHATVVSSRNHQDVSTKFLFQELLRAIHPTPF
ncbi:unnamed protein product [Strongylus vulgaris]|uniref:Uncharacterized protein n=1 Tax=Strongylus vulgaris TaxID=40348 RepID=A0A3P7JEK5_STRVU|nr:unnamed protein product [Strongylus vulgaris]